MIRVVLAGLVTLLAGCKVNPYCIDCERGDSGVQDDAMVSNDAGDGGVGGDAHGDGGSCDPASIGVACPNQTGECASATTACVNGAIACVKNGISVPRAEICDGVDNNCNGTVDEGDPGGGGRCGNGAGTCIQGVEHCMAGALSCVGGTMPVAEICNGQDDDCDGKIDEDLTDLGACGMSGLGACKLGTLSCVGGSTFCTGAVGPGLEICNHIDDDCDGKTDEGFDLHTDPQNCGACGHVCGAGLPGAGNAVWSCSADACVIASCKAGYHDNDGDPANGCEYGQCFITGAEVCDGVDNDCNGVIDETPAIGAAPAICATLGECAGTVAACPCANTPSSVGCTNTQGWTCTYKATVQVDAQGNIVPETLCDGKDNDCNGEIDDHQPQVSHPDSTSLAPQACNDGKLGVCEGTGHFQCDDGTFTGSTPGGNLMGPARCDITQPGAAPSTERCNGKDDDCDGLVDENAPDTMVDVKNASGTVLFHVYAYEASHPDATAASGGSLAQRSCSSPNVLPWTHVTEDEAAAACAAAGARLCTAAEWQLACAGNAGLAYPYGNAYSATSCNGKDYDVGCVAPDSDTLLPSGSSYGCPPPSSSTCVSPVGAYDMSGNVEEWTSTPTSAGTFSVRGGAYDTPAGGLTCQFNVVSFSHDFEIDNLGFRCCSDP